MDSGRPWIDVEAGFDAVFSKLGGCRVDEVVGKGATFKNADYFVRSIPMFAELKCLEKDQMDGLPEKSMTLLKKWIREGVIPPFPPGRSYVEVGKLDKRYQQEAANKLYRQPIIDVIKTANRQLRETKEHFGMIDAPGLLLLANNGNRILEPEIIRYVLASSFTTTSSGKLRFPHIQRVIYLTVNMLNVSDLTDKDVMIWMEPRFEGDDSSLTPFLKRLNDAWKEHCDTVVGVPSDLFMLGSKDIDKVRVRRPWDK